MSASSGTHIQPPTPKNLKQYNAAQPDTCTTTKPIHVSVTTMLQHLHLPTLQQRRQHFKIIMLYRITHQLAIISTATYLTPSTRNTQHCILPCARTHVFKTSFFPSTIKIGNNLQPVITNNTTIPQLRQALQSTPTRPDTNIRQTCLCWANVGPMYVVTLEQCRTPTLDQLCFAHWAYGGPTVGTNHLPTFSQC